MNDNAAMIALLDKWLADESSYDERVYRIVKARLEERDTVVAQRDRLLEACKKAERLLYRGALQSNSQKMMKFDSDAYEVLKAAIAVENSDE